MPFNGLPAETKISKLARTVFIPAIFLMNALRFFERGAIWDGWASLTLSGLLLTGALIAKPGGLKSLRSPAKTTVFVLMPTAAIASVLAPLLFERLLAVALMDSVLIAAILKSRSAPINARADIF